MDAITLALAKQYTNGQRIAWIDSQTLSFDGDVTGKETMELNSIVYARIAESSIDVQSVSGVTLNMSGNEYKCAKSDLSALVEDGIGAVTAAMSNAEIIAVISVPPNHEDVPSGTFVIADGVNYISRVETETIHQIDEKFIPGTVLQTVTLVTEIPGSGSVRLSAEDSALLTDTANKGSLFILAFSFDGTSVKAVPVRADNDGITAYMVTVTTTTIQFVAPLTNDGIWTVSSTEL